MLLYLALAFVVIFLVLFLFILKTLISDFRFRIRAREELSRYECGFEQHNLSRLPISIRYFLLTLVFLLFDLEVIFLLLTPGDIFLGVGKSFRILISLLFVVALSLGLLYEWLDGALDWVM